MFLVELIASSFLELISKQARPECRCKRVLVVNQNAMTQKELRHFALELTPKHRKMLEPAYLHLSKNLGFLTQKETCMVDFFIPDQTITSGQLISET